MQFSPSIIFIYDLISLFCDIVLNIYLYCCSSTSLQRAYRPKPCTLMQTNYYNIGLINSNELQSIGTRFISFLVISRAISLTINNRTYNSVSHSYSFYRLIGILSRISLSHMAWQLNLQISLPGISISSQLCCPFSPLN